MHMVNEVQIELLTYHWNLWKIDIENELVFSIWSCELGIMVKKVGSNQIGNLIFRHNFFLNIRIKPFMIDMCNIMLKRSHQKL